jgi:hypothetical protein
LTSPPTVGTPNAIAVAADAATTPATRCASWDASGSPKRSAFRHGDRARAHGEDVAQDAADAGRRALIGLDEGRVVVALHLEDGGVAVADVDDAGVLARPWITQGALVGSFFRWARVDL